MLEKLGAAFAPHLQPGNKDLLRVQSLASLSLWSTLVQGTLEPCNAGNSCLQNLFPLCLRHYDALSFRLNRDPGALKGLESLAHFMEFSSRKDANFAAKSGHDFVSWKVDLRRWNTFRCVQEVLVKHHRRLGGERGPPGLNFLLLLRLIRRLFPASDFRHPVVTPALALAARCLAKATAKGPHGPSANHWR